MAIVFEDAGIAYLMHTLVDRTAKLGVIHDNAAARTKSRITRAVNRAASGS